VILCAFGANSQCHCTPKAAMCKGLQPFQRKMKSELPRCGYESFTLLVSSTRRSKMPSKKCNRQAGGIEYLPILGTHAEAFTSATQPAEAPTPPWQAPLSVSRRQ